MHEVSGNIISDIMIIFLTGFRYFLVSIMMVAIIAVDAIGQVVVEKSKDKVIISGVPYFIHLVKKGETAYSISKAYNITVEELNKENPPAVYGLKEGQALRLPVRESASAASSQPKPVQPPRDESRYLYHRLQSGQTVYSLSKLYGVSENEIVEANPGIEISRLPVNSEIAIPRRDFMTGKQEFAVQDSKYIFHKVERGESLASIAENYGITIRELTKGKQKHQIPAGG